MDSTLQYLLNEYAERMKSLSDAVGRGMCASYDQYKFTCGQLRGLEAACAVVRDLVDRQENADE